MSKSVLQKSALAVGAALAIGSAGSANAQNLEPQREIEIAVVGADFETPKIEGVRFMDATPKTRSGYERVRGKDDPSLADAGVATKSLIDEYRKIAPGARLLIYKVNPYVRSQATGATMIDMASVSRSMETLNKAGVRVIVAGFGSADKKFGAAFVAHAASKDMIIAAGAPSAGDSKIFPALSDGVLLGASKDGSPMKAAGISAAYAAFTADRRPDLDASMILQISAQMGSFSPQNASVSFDMTAPARARNMLPEREAPRAMAGSFKESDGIESEAARESVKREMRLAFNPSSLNR